jgi:hypothetical protein
MHIDKFKTGPLDIEEAQGVEITIRADGKTLLIRTRSGALLRICRIRGDVMIKDERNAQYGSAWKI